MADPFEILVAGQKVTGWTEAKLSRKREALTGSLNFSLFYPSTPSAPTLRAVKAGAEIVVKVAGAVAFTGSVDARKAKGRAKKSEGGELNVSTSIGKDSYSIEITARGKAKSLIDSSHSHPTGTMKQVTSADIVRKLIAPHGLKLIDNALDTIKLEKARFRDGASILSEITRFTREHNLLCHETRDGSLQIIKPGSEPRGADLVLGRNILSFEASQSEDTSNSSVTVKGQRTGAAQHGTDAIKRSITATLEGSTPAVFRPYVLQLTGDATDERLKARAQAEFRERQEASKEITVDVFGVTQSGGAPWDIGVKHYVEIPSEGIFNDSLARANAGHQKKRPHCGENSDGCYIGCALHGRLSGAAGKTGDDGNGSCSSAARKRRDGARYAATRAKRALPRRSARECRR
ncbi:hypothetical protein IY145_17780 [Methylosinus sp. H3A]|uniref:phage baseplate assembly protein n=1 Tax=Methylosinus sp. H3A TaxID=2785786 RepID=UPI0018C2D355|nr:hypothetical protein [Methylosinus sp. H3A]MBG0811209.1 hypothetical protein [Methylosinus sp. H3A]